MAEVSDTDQLLRHVKDREDFLVWHDDFERFVPHLAAIRFDPDGMSTFVERILNEGGRTRQDVASIGGTRPPQLVFGMSAAAMRSLALEVAHSPNSDSPIGFAHASVAGPGMTTPDRDTRHDLAQVMVCVVGSPSISRPS